MHPGERLRNASKTNLSRKELSEISNEAELVKELVASLKVPNVVRRELFSRAKSFGRRVNVQDFRSLIQMPCMFTVCRPVNIRDNLKVSRWFNLGYITSQSFVKQFYDDKADVIGNEDEPHAMLIKWPYFGVVVLHDVQHQLKGETARMAYVYEDEGQTRTFYMEGLPSFLELLRQYGPLPFDKVV